MTAPHRAGNVAALERGSILHQAHVGEPAQHLLMAPLVHLPLQVATGKRTLRTTTCCVAAGRVGGRSTRALLSCNPTGTY